MSFAVTSLDFTNAKAILDQGLALLKSGENSIDFEGLTHVDSASVAVMVAWQRYANTSKLQLKFANVPAELVSLISLYGVEDLFALN